jgi:hypothetical protein
LKPAQLPAIRVRTGAQSNAEELGATAASVGRALPKYSWLERLREINNACLTAFATACEYPITRQNEIDQTADRNAKESSKKDVRRKEFAEQCQAYGNTPTRHGAEATGRQPEKILLNDRPAKATSRKGYSTIEGKVPGHGDKDGKRPGHGECNSYLEERA